MNKRIYYLDRIKVLLCILVICVHTSIAYGGSGIWYYNEKNFNAVECVIFTNFAGLIQSFSMGLFFFVSSYFMPASLKKKDTKKFLIDRLKRLGIPLIVFYLLLNSLTMYLADYFQNGRKISFIKYWLDFHSFGPGPLWFVQALLIFTIGYIIVLRIKKTPIRVTKIIDRIVLKTILIMAVASFIVRIFMPTGHAILGMQLGYFSQYVVMFIYGCIAYNNDLMSKIDKKFADKWFIISLITIPILFIVISIGGGFNNIDVLLGGFSWQSFAYCLWEPFMCIGISLKLIALFRDKYDYKKEFMSELSKCTYGIFIIHAPINVAIECLLMNVKIDLFIKFIISVVCTFFIAFVLTEGYYKVKDRIMK